jgi:hypothetical protein
MATHPRRLAVWTALLALLLAPALAGASPAAGTESDTVQQGAPAGKPGEPEKKKAPAEPAEKKEGEKKDEEKKDEEKKEGEKAEGEKTEGDEAAAEKKEGEKAEGADKDKVGTFEDIWSPGFVVKGAEMLFVALLEGSDS